MNPLPSLYQICRTCTMPSTIVYPIYGSYNLDYILSTLFHINITPEDKLPKVVCGPCFRSIANTAMLQQKFKAAEYHLAQNLVSTPQLPREIEQQITIKVIEEPRPMDLTKQKRPEKTEKPPKEYQRVNKKYICKPCKKGFTDKKLHFRHMRLFHATANYPCDICEADFDSRHKLGLHKSTEHWNHFPYKCEYCSSDFKQFTILKRHILEQHNKVINGEIDF
ncbi:GDNF-inducible zinc finger protein 1-like [Culicoides brevitarsis]|uniref:GDNF-inducible zinc finger protein 1-like n=1 Tax=Culicoides brevitarsis TaxID=469753 RepID=UPI00307B28D9